ncbi:MAG: flagellar biosynthesis protein FlhA [Candidatus Zixiibacteriota bacterium]
MPSAPSTTSGFGKHADIFLALGVMCILIVLVIPVPPALLDVLLAFNISFSIIVLLTTLYINRPLELSVFPGMLLVVTLLRLSLNVASTRLILGEAFAGDVINAFGTFVVKGNYVVGFIVFLILVVIQFVVITKGAGRISEVAARFTLDAMPGKQMAIDADLNAGLVTEADARRRREDISKEADFYGAMDGASKFVRGDAIAGILITIINVIGGFIIGVLQKGMPIKEALTTYTLLSVGDGLVSQVPALIIATSAGLLVTRAASSANLGSEMSRQLLSRPRAILIASGILFFFALMPGLPSIPFGILGILVGITGITLSKSQREAKKNAQGDTEVQRPEHEETPEAQAEDFLRLDTLELEIGYGLIPLVDVQQEGDLLARVGMIRKQLAQELGIIVPPIRIRDNVQLKPNQYELKVKGITVAKYELMVDHLLAINPGNLKDDLEGFKSVDPAFGLQAKWIIANLKDLAEMKGFTVVEPAAVIATHLTEVVKEHAAEVLTRQDVQNLIDGVKKDAPAAIDGVIPEIVSLGVLHKVMQNLLEERVPIRDMQSILEVIADYGEATKDPDVLSEYSRLALRRTITNMFLNPEGKINVFTLDPNVEKILTDSVQAQKSGLTFVLPPEVSERILQKVTVEAEKLASAGEIPLALVPANLRLALRRLLASVRPTVSVLSYNEIIPEIEVYSVAIIGLGENAN